MGTEEDGGVTEEMIAENERVREEILEEEQKKMDLLAAADHGNKNNQKYKQLEFLLQKSTAYTQYLFTRMKAQQEETRLKAERRAKMEARNSKKQTGNKSRGKRAQNADTRSSSARRQLRRRNEIE